MCLSSIAACPKALIQIMLRLTLAPQFVGTNMNRSCWLKVISDNNTCCTDYCKALLLCTHFEQTMHCLFSSAFRSVVLNKDEEWTRRDRGLLLDFLCLVWGRSWYYQQSRKSDKNRAAHLFSEEDESDHLGSIRLFSVSSLPAKSQQKLRLGMEAFQLFCSPPSCSVRSQADQPQPPETQLPVFPISPHPLLLHLQPLHRQVNLR